MSKQHENDVLCGHPEESDGIQEYDNRLPPWWVWLFYATIIWGGWVLADWHILNNRSLAAAYDEEAAAMHAKYPSDPVPVVADAEHVEAGRALFAANCIACHLADATGKIGPNLTDQTWIHGGKAEEINNTIFHGVLVKGMPAWGMVLGPAKVASLAAYVHSLGGGVPDAQ